jgi:hypothetical protein
VFAEYLSRDGVTSFSELSPPLCDHLRVLLRFGHERHSRFTTLARRWSLWPLPYGICARAEVRVSSERLVIEFRLGHSLCLWANTFLTYKTNIEMST